MKKLILICTDRKIDYISHLTSDFKLAVCKNCWAFLARHEDGRNINHPLGRTCKKHEWYEAETEEIQDGTTN